MELGKQGVPLSPGQGRGAVLTGLGIEGSWDLQRPSSEVRGELGPKPSSPSPIFPAKSHAPPRKPTLSDFFKKEQFAQSVLQPEAWGRNMKKRWQEGRLPGKGRQPNTGRWVPAKGQGQGTE